MFLLMTINNTKTVCKFVRGVFFFPGIYCGQASWVSAHSPSYSQLCINIQFYTSQKHQLMMNGTKPIQSQYLLINLGLLIEL